MFFGYAPGKDIYYEVEGEGPPVLFVPGWTMDHSVFQQQKDYFSKEHRVILFDPPGTGASARFERYDFTLYTDVLSALISFLDLRSLTCVCWSMGGEIGIRYCHREKDRVARLVLVCSTPSFVQRDGWTYGMPVAVARRFRRGLDRDPAATFALFRKETMQGNAGRHIETVLIRSGIRSDLQMAKDLFDEFLVQDERPLLSDLTVPVLVMSGEHDAVCHPQASAHLASHIPGACAELFDAGHVPFLYMPERFNDRVRLFLR